ncbi:MAG TPA: DUF6582 domain-containing protein [Gammaproteobacteria bacterium]|jgi:hypothetical protein
MAKLTTEQRKALPESDFAVPETRDLPMHDQDHVKMAWNMVDKTKDLSDVQRTEARRRILERAKSLGIDTSDWHTIKAMAFEAISLEAMSVEVPETPDHPNKVPFSGVLCFVDRPSDKAPEGSKGKRVIITAAAARAAIPTILLMGVDYKEKFDGHDVTKKIGVITAGDVVGEEFQIKGFLYGSDFPEQVAYIQAHKDELGFSYEVKRALIASMDEPVLTVESLIFSGAAILKKKDAAYTSTSLSANADAEIDMTKEELTALFAEAEKNMASKIEAAVAEALKKNTDTSLSAASVLSKVKKHSDSLRSCAAGMEADGIGMHNTGGHVHLLRRMADNMEAEASKGSLPSYYNSGSDFHAAAQPSEADLKAAADKQKADITAAVTAALEPLKTEFADLKAKAFDKAAGPERKTLPASIQQLVDKGHLKLDAAADADAKVSAADLDKALTAAGVTSISQRMAFKTELAAAGRLA